jgi:hypothetical protein
MTAPGAGGALPPGALLLEGASPSAGRVMVRTPARVLDAVVTRSPPMRWAARSMDTAPAAKSTSPQVRASSSPGRAPVDRATR